MRHSIILHLLLAFPALADAQVYKCVEPASGKTIYLQSPCPAGTRSEAVRRAVPSAPAAAPAAGDAAGKAAKSSGPKTAAEMEQEFRKRRQEQEDARKKEEEKSSAASAKEENCNNARQQLASLESGTRQARVDSKGERYFLDDQQIEQEKARARKAVEASCK